MKRTSKKAATSRRGRAVRTDASVRASERAAERLLKLPRGSVRIVLPDGSDARGDETIKALLRDYGEQ